MSGIPYNMQANKSKSAQKNKNRKSKSPSAPPKNRLALAPSAQGRVRALGDPKWSLLGKGDGSVMIRHREYIGEVTGSAAFGVDSFNVNPGLPTFLPWLSTIANSYESYNFRRLCFEYETERATSAAGSLMMAIDYDAADRAPVSKQEMMAMHGAVRSPVWSECQLVCDAKDLAKYKERFVRPGALASNLDVKTYDVGRFFVATQGADTSAQGELYVSYDVELHTPQPGLEAVVYGQCSYVASGGTVSKAACFGDAATASGGLAVTASGNTLTFPMPGAYLVRQSVGGTVFTDTAATVSSSTGTVSVQTGNAFQNAAATVAVGIWIVTTTAADQTLVVDWNAVCTTLTSSVTLVAPYDINLSV